MVYSVDYIFMTVNRVINIALIWLIIWDNTLLLKEFDYNFNLEYKEIIDFKGGYMATCPNCNHNPYGFSHNWMWIYVCNDCGDHFCHECGTMAAGDNVNCAHCGSENTQKDYECYGEES